MSDVFLFVIKVLASLSALYMCISPSTALYKIHKRKSTGDMSIVPLIALWACDHMWMLYGYVTDDTFPLLVTYAAGSVLNIGFIVVYYRYSTRRAYVLKVSAIALACNAAVTMYAVMSKHHALLHESPETRNQVVGYIAVGSSLLLYASPFAAISRVVKTKSSASIPITMSFVGAVNNTLWMIYGFLLGDLVLIVPTGISLVLVLVQIVLFAVYHPTRPLCGRRSPAATAVGNLTLPTIVTPSSGKQALHFASMVTPKSSALESGDAGVTTCTMQIQSEVELSKITLEAPSYDEVTRAPQLPVLPNPEQ